ncbi:MAG: pitrilysin family protein [Propionibacteriaceae bacterium]|nr:pitrilysin family protein [Propionibacteriaceae bacterium]
MRPSITHASAWRFPLPETHLLDSGVRVLAFHLPGQHVVAAELVLDCGVNAEPAHLEGIATIAARTSDEGTLDHPGSDIAEALESHGAAVHAHQGHYTAQLRLEVPSTRLLTSLGLFAEIARTPQLADADIAHQIDMALADHAARLASPRGAAGLAFRKAMYAPSDRRTRPEAGIPETLTSITGDAVRAFHREHWGPSGAVLILAGDLPPGTIGCVSDAFDGWAAQRRLPDSPASLAERPRVLVVDRPRAVQADVIIGCPAVSRQDPRLAPAVLAGQAMAGAFSSRLNLALREERGYCYGIHGGFTPGRHGGVFSVSGSFRTEVASDAISVALSLLGLTEAFSTGEIDAARNHHLGISPLVNSTASDIADQAARLADGRVDVGYLHRLDDDILTVTPETATAVFRDLVRPDRLHIAVTGPADLLCPQLAALGLSPEVVDLGATA